MNTKAFLLIVLCLVLVMGGAMLVIDKRIIAPEPEPVAIHLIEENADRAKGLQQIFFLWEEIPDDWADGK